jgi:sulfur carrier protein ThiS
MKVFVKLIATYRQHLPPNTRGNTTVVNVAADTSVAEVLAPLGIPLDKSSVIVLNGLTVDLDTLVKEGDTITAFSAVAGG